MTTEHRALIEQLADALESIALAGMSGCGQESEEAMIEWHARQAWNFISIAARALEPAREYLAAPEQSEPVMYQFRNIVEGEPRTEWEEVKPRNPHMGAVQDQITDLLAYRYKGQPSYEVRALYAAPQPTAPEPVNQMLLADESLLAPPTSARPGPKIIDMSRLPLMHGQEAYRMAKALSDHLAVVPAAEQAQKGKAK